MANATATANTLPAGTKHKDMGEALTPGNYELKIVKSQTDGGKEGPYQELEALHKAQFDFSEQQDSECKTVTVRTLKAGHGVKEGNKHREKTRLELYNEHLAEGKKLEHESHLPTEFGERRYVTVQYPDGFTKDHQVKNVEDLAPKITSQMRGHYGVTSVKFLSLPPSLEEGEVVEVAVE